MVIRNPSDYVKRKYDDTKNIVETILSDGVQEVSTADTNSKRVADGYHYAGEYDGADADARLDNALSAASDGDTIFLEGANYTADRTISTKLTVIAKCRGVGGSEAGRLDGATWTVNSRAALIGLNISNNATINADASFYITLKQTLGTPTINVNGDRFRMYGCRGGSVTFANGTSGGIVDACTGVSVTDNGSNTVGDIA